MTGDTTTREGVPPPPRDFGGVGYPYPHPHGFGSGGRVPGSPLPPTTAATCFLMIFNDFHDFRISSEIREKLDNFWSLKLRT